MRGSDRAYIGFSCELELKKRAQSHARRSGNASLGSVCRKALEKYLNHRNGELTKQQIMGMNKLNI